ncbi:CinA family protein [sulfur-oxidizing endosymbiont of Gigantopelta aegis]|uniref:CinA family protein n=1 Tax=sulfur-oxidizing endosymbiont of Gigantopelta aegis TaxID=2794934 RepID=UPI0018DBCF73|nr:nicotinamide-nucleotide amidohydrolase family protein [sulfur-oxidizing endosymbiont of Gigantopelta aegis]
MIDVILNDLAKLCLQQQLQVTTAESCTGGLVAKLMTDLPGSSQWFERGFVTYSNLAKEQMLGVETSLLSEFGAVSEEVALAMVKGALAHSQAQLALSITGIAGPGGGSDSKPVGLVCFGWAYSGDKAIIATTEQQQFSGDRDAVRQQSALYALQKLLEIALP